MRVLIAAMLLLAGIVHLLPVSGVLGSTQLASLYGLPFDDPNLAILMRHRAVLFALLGALLVAAAFKARWQGLALVAGFVSAASFVLLAWSTGDYNDRIARVVWADVAATGCLLVAAIARAVHVHRARGGG